MASTIKRVLCVALLSATAILAASSGDERSAGRAQVVGLAQHESRRLEREAWNDDRGAVESCGACCFVVASNDGSLDPFYARSSTSLASRSHPRPLCAIRRCSRPRIRWRAWRGTAPTSSRR